MVIVGAITTVVSAWLQVRVQRQCLRQEACRDHICSPLSYSGVVELGEHGIVIAVGTSAAGRGVPLDDNR
jgi:hypothetical protein